MINKYVIMFILIIFIVRFIIKKSKSISIHNNSILCFTGALGSGKTFMAVKYAVSRYKFEYFLYKIKLCQKPFLISNIPIRISKRKWAHVLTREHLLLEEHIPERSIIVIDELGGIASQYDYKDKNVIGAFSEFVRFFRHYVNGKFIFTDQTISDVIYTVRRRVIVNYCLENFKKGLIFPIYTIDLTVNRIVDGETTMNVNDMNKNKTDYFYGILPFWKLYKNYDSRCYSENYKPLKSFNGTKKWSKYKTNYVIDIKDNKPNRAK